MSVQDDARENIMVMMFNLNQEPDRARHDPDAYLDHSGHRFLFELKSTTNKSISTVRDFGPEHINKWLDMHWIVGFFKTSERKPKYCYYLTPIDMKEWTDQIWEYIKLDFGLADIAASRISKEDVFKLFGNKNAYTISDAKKVQKNQYSTSEYREKCDLPGGISKAMIHSIRCPFVDDEWFENKIGLKEIYDETDLNCLVGYQSSVELIVESVGKTFLNKEDFQNVLPGLIISRLTPKQFETGISVLNAKRKIEWLATKAAKKYVFDVEPALSISAMVNVLKDRCKYLINRGSTLNNPHIPEEFFQRFDKISDEHASELRKKLTQFLLDNPPEAVVGKAR